MEGQVDFDVLIVGAGLSGCVLAEKLATEKNLKVLIIEKRDHIGGNCYDFIDENDILMNKYGAHLFHTESERAWEYVNSFDEWVRWDHRTIGNVDGQHVSIPVNINTVNKLCNANIKTIEEMDQWLEKTQIKYDKIENSEQMGKSRVGEVLYEKIFKQYTKKQWDKYPEELDASVLARIPIRNNFDDRYFSDRYQALPKQGYTHFIQQIINHPNITAEVNIDFFDFKVKHADYLQDKLLIFTGPIDHYFADKGMERLEYRSINFVVERYKNMNFYQPGSVFNFPGLEVPYTRIVEYKHFLNQKSPHTTIVKELSKEDGDPYYPVPNKKNMDLYEKYKVLAEQEKNVHFVGRLASYKYFNMDQAILNALDYYDNVFKDSLEKKQ